jgi:translocation and assembly module TamB
VIVVGAIVALNSPVVLNKIASKYAPSVGFSYSKIDGNIFDGISIHNPIYQHKKLASKLTLRYNPIALLNSTISISKLEIYDLNTTALQQLIPQDNNSSSDDNSSVKLPLKLKLSHFHLSLLPTVIDVVHLHKLVLDVDDLKFDLSDMVCKSADIKLDVKTNLSNINQSAKIKDNRYIAKMVLHPNNHLFDLYKLPIRKEAISDIKIDFDLSQDNIIANIKASATNILQTTDSNETKEIRVDINSLDSNVSYTFASQKLDAKSSVVISTPYAKDIKLYNLFKMDKNISYSGDIKVAKILKLDANISKLVDNLAIKYQGDLNSTKIDLSSNAFTGDITTSNMQNIDINLQSKDYIMLNEFAKLPSKLQDAKAKLAITAPIDTKDINHIKAKANIISNLVNIQSDISYSKDISVASKLTMPKDSLLSNLDKKLQINAIMPMDVKADIKSNTKVLNIKSSKIQSNIKMQDNKLKGYINLASLHSTIEGNLDGDMVVSTKVSSIQNLISQIKQIYEIGKLPNIDGDIQANIKLDKSKNIKLNLASNKITIKDKKKTTAINDIKLDLFKKDNSILIDAYQLSYDDIKVFATKQSKIDINGEDIILSPLWVNDKLQLTGNYNKLKNQGDINAIAKMLHISQKMIELDSDIDITTSIDDKRIDVNGEIVLQGGNIHYDINKKTFASDDDIVIVQELQKKKKAKENDNLNINLQISSNKPLILKQKNIDIKANVDLMVNKQGGSELMMVGAIELQKGGVYNFEGKKFVLEKSYIYFTGDASKPYLDITIKYKSVDYLIKIMVSGTPSMPVISFSSQPALSKEQILSVILFDSADAAGSKSGEDMMRMMGGAMAKSALSDMGVKLDHLVIGSGSIEVGKKIGEKTTVIYIDGEIPTVKVKYEHTPHLESVVSANEQSQSYDIVYKNDYEKASDIVFIGR